MAVKFQFRRDTATNWETNNPILSEGEFGLDTTNQRFKIGDGVNTWNNIEFSQYTNKAEYEEYTTTIAIADWTGTGPFTVAKTVSGILATDVPIIDIDLSTVAFADVPDYLGEWGFVYRVVATLNTLTFYATETPTKDFDINIKVVR